MNLDTILTWKSFDHPFFAAFILDKYQDIRHTHPGEAKKIEDNVFTPSFLETLLFANHGSLCHKALHWIPPHFFAPVAGQIKTLLDQGLDSDRKEEMALGILKTLDGPAHGKAYEKKAPGFLDRTPVTIENFYWLDHCPDLPAPLQQECFDRSIKLFKDHMETLKADMGYGLLVRNHFHTALELDRREAVFLAREYLKNKAKTFDPEVDDLNDFSFDFFSLLSRNPPGDSPFFEFDYIFGMLENTPPPIPALVARAYTPEGAAMDKFLETWFHQEEIHGMMASLPLPDADTTLVETIARELSRDKELLGLLEKADLALDTALVFAAILWQAQRLPTLELDGCTPEELVEYISFNRRSPLHGKNVLALMKEMDSKTQEALLTPALGRAIESWKKEGAFDAVANVMETMIALKNPAFLPVIVTSLVWEEPCDEFKFNRSIIHTLATSEDFKALDAIMDKVPEARLLDLLDIIRQAATPAAEDFLLNHLDRFMAAHRADTLDACKALVSERALEQMDHKVGKGQIGIDALYVAVKSFKGEAGPHTQELLDALGREEEKIREAFMNMEKGTPSPIITLELECPQCKDISLYPCNNIIISPEGEPYVAQELTCIGCNKITELAPTKSGQATINMEVFKTLDPDAPDLGENPPLPGAVKIRRTGVMGKAMSISQGIALYKNKIKKQPKNPENYIGLGNLYRSNTQYTLASAQYEAAIKHGPFYIEPYLSLAQIAEDRQDPKTALTHLEKGRPFLKRPLICKGLQNTGEEIIEAYKEMHFHLVMETKAKVSLIEDGELAPAGKALTKIGRNEKCPCGSGKKYKKCCLKKS